MGLAKSNFATNSIKHLMLRSLDWMMRPMAEIVVRAGIPASDFARMFERACVDVANKKLRVNGKTNYSRVAILTGIERKKVKAYIDELNSDSEYLIPNKVDIISAIMNAWYNEDEYLDDSKNPIPLTKRGPGPSIQKLVADYGRDLTAAVVLQEMLLSGTVVEDRGYFLPAKRGYFPAQSSPDLIETFGTHSRDYLETMNYNLNLQRNIKDFRYQQAAICKVPESQLPEIKREIRKSMNASLHNIDDYLTIRRASSAEGEKMVRLGVGMFEIQGGRSIHDE